MADCLLYWKFFWKDFRRNPLSLNHDWYTKSIYFFDQVSPGDSLWVVVRAGLGPPNNTEWRLLQRIVIYKLTIEQCERPYHAIGDIRRSQHFDIRTQSDLTPLLHKLEFVSGKKILGKGGKIGQSLQSIRPLSKKDSNLLEQYAKSLTVLKDVNSFYKSVFSSSP